MARQFDAEKFAKAVEAMAPRSEALKLLAKVPLFGSLITAFYELCHFRKVFLVKRVLAEQGLSNWVLFSNFAIAFALAWAMSFSWKFAVAGAIVTFTQPNTLGVLFLCLGLAVTGFFLQSLVTCAAFGIGTWRHAKSQSKLIANIPSKRNIFTPKDFETKAPGLDRPTFPKLQKPVKVPPPSSLPVMSTALKDDETELVSQLVNDVNALTSKAHYRLDELWPELVDLYYLDFYVAQVRNGGHSQFTHNSKANFQQVLGATNGALSSTQMPKVSAVFHDFQKWCEQNPQKVSEQTGFSGGRAPELDELDGLLYDALEQEEYPNALAHWFSEWTFATAVADSDYKAARDAMLDENPDRERRRLIQHLNKTREFLENRERLGAMLALNADQNTAIFTSIQNGAYYDFDGKQEFAWRFHHSEGQGYLRVLEGGYAYHPQVGQNFSFPSFGSGATQEELNAAFEAYNTLEDKPRPGPVAAHLTISQVDAVQDRLKDGAYADMIFATLAAAGVSTDVRGMVMGRYPDDKESDLTVLVGDESGRVYKVEIMRQSLTGLQEITTGQKMSPKLFEITPMREFIQELEAAQP